MLTGRDTVPAALAATGWRRREEWGGVLARVRHVALGFGDERPTANPTTVAGTLAVLAVGGIVDLDAAPAPLDEEALAAVGAVVDEREPDAYERRWRTVQPGDDAVRGDGGLTWTHGGLLWAARSVVQHLGLGDGDRLHVRGLDGVRGLVARTVAPLLAGAAVVDVPDATATTFGTGLVVVPGIAVPVAGDRPLPGVTVGIADDDEVLVRSDAVSPSACAPDGWLHTGRRGRLDGERLVLT